MGDNFRNGQRARLTMHIIYLMAANLQRLRRVKCLLKTDLVTFQRHSGGKDFEN